MKKWIAVFLALGSMICADEKEENGKELCSFTKDIFSILESHSRIVDQETLEKAYTSSIARLQEYEKGANPEIAALAERFIQSMQGQKDNEELSDAISSLGRLLKCSVDDEYFRSDTPYILHKGDIQKQLGAMETLLGDRVPKGKEVNFHKLMIESLADEKFDLALYSYLKIAETRCSKS